MNAIPPFNTSLKLAKFTLSSSAEVTETMQLKQNGIELLWLLQSFNQNLPLFNGYFSRFSTVNLPQTVIAYMDPIYQPPTRNDVVQETMVRSMKVAKEMNEEYAVVTYDLAVALKAYSIQALKIPQFDKLIILLGNFHLEMAYFGAIGTFIAESGIEHLLTESGILAAGSLNGFMKGKFYNRSTRIHQILAAAMEREMFLRFKQSLTEEETSLLEDVLSNLNGDAEYCQGFVEGA